LRQREVAAALDIKPGTYACAESAAHVVFSRKRAEILCNFYDLAPEVRARVMAAWDACPLSPHGESRRKHWEKRNKLRSKAKNHDRIKLALVDLLGLRLMETPDDQICSCDFGAPACATCAGLEAVGAPQFTPADRDRILGRLAAIAEKLRAPE